MKDSKVHKNHSIIICNESEAEYNNLNISRTCKILKSVAEDNDCSIERIFRIPIFDKNKAEKKWIEIIKFYGISPHIHKIFASSLSEIHSFNPKFISILITYLVKNITEKKLELYNHETAITINSKSSREQWFSLLGKKHQEKVEEVIIANEFKDTTLEDMDKRINWSCDVLYINSNRISESFPDLFRVPSSWTKSLFLKFKGIDNVLDFFKVKHPNIKKYHVKEAKLRAWNLVLSMFDMKTTQMILQKKYNCSFDIKR